MRLALLLLVALSLMAGAARADTINVFDVSGTAQNATFPPISLGSCGAGAFCSFSGTLTVDVTSGTAEAMDVTLPGLSGFDTLRASGGVGPLTLPPSGGWMLVAGNANSTTLPLTLYFTTTPIPGSLVGFEGGSINYGFVLPPQGFFLTPAGNIFASFSGTITPVPATVPEPSSLALLGLGLVSCLGFAVVRRTSVKTAKQRDGIR